MRIHTRQRLDVTVAGALLFSASLLLVAGSCTKTPAPQAPYRHAAIATAAPLATAVGLDIFRKGGNAFDVAVAVGFALAVVHPQAGNIGGGGFAVMRDGKSGKVTALDFRETAPVVTSADMFLDSAGEVIENASTRGAMAVGTPGTVAGLRAIWEQHGSVPWRELVLPAVALADSGFLLDEYQANSLNEYHDELNLFSGTAAIFLQNGDSAHAGDRFVQKDLARTLERIATGGADGFYQGPTAELMIVTMHKYGGRLLMYDLQGYKPIWREPTAVELAGGYDVYSMPPPSSGGIAVAQILKLLEPFDVAQYGPDSAEYIHLFCEAARLVYADRATYLGDPGFYDVPVTLLNNDSAYIAERRRLIDPDRASVSADVHAGDPLRYESDQTTHFSVCDSVGNMVALTYTLNSNYGSKLVVEGAGFLLNNEMDDFSIKPGVPNLYGLIGGEANKIEPRKRMLSSMSPTIVLKNGTPFAILGTGGGSKIITAVAEAILDLTQFGMDAQATSAQSRFHHQWLPDTLYLEEGGFSAAVKSQLEAMGHTVRERSRYGDLQVIVIDSLGEMTPVSDPRGRGVGGGY